MRPTQRALLVIALWAGLALVLAIVTWLPAFTMQAMLQSFLLTSWKIATATILVLFLLDALSLFRLPAFSVSRQHTDNLALGAWTNISLRIRNNLARPVALKFFDHTPTTAEAEHACQSAHLQSGEQKEFHYRLRMLTRGNQDFGPTDLLIPSTLGLWQRRILAGSTSSLKVYPNYATISQYALMMAAQQSSQLGIRRRPRRGEGTEFHQLREFRQADSLRQIDWNATARLRKPISKEYQEEKDQQVLFLVDCGRRMRSRDGDHSLLDHALNAMLLMSHVALKQGDAVGLLSFGGKERWLKPGKGVVQLSRLINTVYDLDTTTQASDYSAAVRHLLGRHNKRSLIVLLTDLQDGNTDDLLPALRLLQQKHLVLLANLQEPALRQTLQTPVNRFDEALCYAGTLAWLDQRRQVSRQLNHQGILTLDCTPQELPVQLINRYVEIKQQGLL